MVPLGLLLIPRGFPPRACVSALALTPAQQYAQQQQQQREARMRRLEAEQLAADGEAAPPPEDDADFVSRFAAQLKAFDTTLFPPDQYSQRNQQSRKDGYWAFVGKGEEPPLDFTYGEFPLPLFSKLVDRACEYRGLQTANARRNAVLADLGSGAGRLALWAAATSEWKRVVGVEYLPSLAAEASAKLVMARDVAHFPELLQTTNVELVEGSWDDPMALFGDIDIAFAYTTAITADERGVLVDLSAALTKRLRRGCVVVTTDYTLDPAGFEVLESIEGANPGVGGVSTGYIHRKTCAGETDTDDTPPAGVSAPQPAESAEQRAEQPAEQLAGVDALEASLLADLRASFEAEEAALESSLLAAFGAAPAAAAPAAAPEADAVAATSTMDAEAGVLSAAPEAGAPGELSQTVAGAPGELSQTVASAPGELSQTVAELEAERERLEAVLEDAYDSEAIRELSAINAKLDVVRGVDRSAVRIADPRDVTSEAAARAAWMAKVELDDLSGPAAAAEAPLADEAPGEGF